MSRRLQEVVPVEAVSGGRCRARLPWLVAGAAALVCLVIAAAVWWLGRDGEAPAPPDAAGPTVQQQTALMWAEWEVNTATSTCLAEHGFDEPPGLFETRLYASAVAQLLGVTPTYGGPVRSFVMPELDAGTVDGWNQWHADASEGGCVVKLGPTDASDAAAVEQAVASARQDEGFRTALAGLAWSQEQAELQLAKDADLLLSGGRVELADAVAARATLDRLVSAGEQSSSWAKLGVEEGTEAITAYGSDGVTPIAIVVEAAGSAHDFEWQYSGVNGQRLLCGDVRVLVVIPQTIYAFDDSDRTADDLWAAMIEACGS